MTISVVQHASVTKNQASGTTATAAPTFASNATAGNCLVACITVGVQHGTPSISSVTTNGTAEHWVLAKSQTVNSTFINDGIQVVAVYVNPNTGGGQKIIDVNCSFTTSLASGNDAEILVDIYEVSGLVSSSVTDKTASSQVAAGSTSWTSTATATTSQASEIFIGVVGANGFSGVAAITGPSSPWTNETTLNSSYGSGTCLTAQRSGFNIVSSTGTATYSGTITNDDGGYAAVVATLLGGATGPTATGSVKVPKPSLSGTATYATAAHGSVKVPKPALAGTATAFPAATGSVKVPKPVLAGSAAFGPSAHGSVKVPKPALSGSATAFPAARGSVAVPKPVLAGTVTVANPVNGSGSVKVPKPVLAGTATVANPDAATGSVKVPKPALHGTAKFGPSAHGSVKVPKPALHGTAVFQIPQVILSITSAATTDPFGNPVDPGGFAVYNNGQIAFLGQSTTVPGENVLRMSSGAALEGSPFEVNNAAEGSGGSAFISSGIIGPAANLSGHGDFVEISLNTANAGGTSSANMEFFYVDSSGTAHQFAFMDDTGFNIVTGSINGVTPSDQFAPAQGTNGFGGGVWTAGQQTALLALQATMNSIITQLQATGWFV